jgi:hypothetical protein
MGMSAKMGMIFNGLIVLLFFSFIWPDKSENKPERYYVDGYVECFYPKSDSFPLFIYDTHQGNCIDTLLNGAEYQWYKMALRSSKPDQWFELEHLIQMPGRPVKEFTNHEGHWVHFANLQLFVPDISGNLKVCFFENHDLNSSVVHQVNHYQKLILLEIWQDWAKVCFWENGKKIEVWLPKADQCAAPWTNCTQAGKTCQ